MGWTEERISQDGTPRYIAKYRDLRGHKQSAGTYSTDKAAKAAWQVAEVKQAEGRTTDPRRGRQLFRRYVEEEWLPNHVMEADTRETHTYQIYKHIMPWFGAMKMIEIMPSDVREWVTHLTREGVTPATIQNLKSILSAIFSTAFGEVIFIHPCKGVKTPTVAVMPPVIISPEQFDAIYEALPDDFKLLAETDMETGARWGELTELRVKDLAPETCILTVSRAVVQVSPKFHPEGKRFLVKPYPKNKKFRRFKVSRQLSEKITAHVEARKLEPNDLLFELRQDPDARRRLCAVPNPEELGWTEPNAAGRTYRHGTLSAYSAGKCHCEHCRAAYAIYRAERRARGTDSPRKPRLVDTDGHIPRDWFREHVWQPALAKADLSIHVPFKFMRHAHASWLLHGGADLQVVKERMGHAKISTTERYLGTLPEVDETALDAFARVRNRSGKGA
jgi:integrase